MFKKKCSERGIIVVPHVFLMAKRLWSLGAEMTQAQRKERRGSENADLESLRDRPSILSQPPPLSPPNFSNALEQEILMLILYRTLQNQNAA